MGFVAEDLTTNRSMSIFSQWLKGNCQPNYRKVCLCVCMSNTQSVRSSVFLPVLDTEDRYYQKNPLMGVFMSRSVGVLLFLK